MPRRVEISREGVRGPGIDVMRCNVEKRMPRVMKNSAISVAWGPKRRRTHSKAVMASTAKTHDESLLASTGWIRYNVFPSKKVLGSIRTNPAAKFRHTLFVVLRSQNFAGTSRRGSSVESKHSRNSVIGRRCIKELPSWWQPMDRMTSTQS